MITSIRPHSFFPNPFASAPRVEADRQVASMQAQPRQEPVNEHLKPLQELTQAMNRLDCMFGSPVFQPVE